MLEVKKIDVHDHLGRGRKRVADIKVAQKYLQILKSAKDRGIEFDMSIKRVRQLLNTKNCTYTGEVMYLAEYKEVPKKIADNCLSFDRKDNDKGYTDDNVIACTKRINTAKGNLTNKEILSLAKMINKDIAKEKKKKLEAKEKAKIKKLIQNGNH